MALYKTNYKYKKAERFIVFNDNDEDLSPISYELPVPPPDEDIDGFGLPPGEQFFKRPHFSKRLRELMRKKGLLPSQKWKIIENNTEFYAEEISFLEKEWNRIENGYWFFNNGRPTYISGCNYFYLVYWNLDVGFPAFRMRDREFFLFLLMCEEDPFCFGFNYPKLRREGATSKASCWRYWKAITGKAIHAALQSKTEDDAEKVHNKHILLAWRKMPFWVTPIFDGKLDSQRAITFSSPQVKSSPDYNSEALDSWIDYENASENAYDGTKIHALHNDEIGKCMDLDVDKRWQIQKPCLKVGSRKIGIAVNTSTVEEMDNKGGQKFKDICDASHFHTKSEITKQTASGLYNFFIPASEGYEGDDPVTGKPFIDKFGFTNTEAVTNYLLAEREMFRKAGNMEKVIELTRQNPLKWKECWLRSAAGCLFNLHVIENRLDHYRNGNADKRRGNFEWKDNTPDSKVIWHDTPNGKFYTSFLFEHEQFSNMQTTDNGIRFPRNVLKFVAGGDPFKYKKTIGKRQSFGAGAVFYKFDPTVDSPNSPRENWKSERFVCTYKHRPAEKNEYGEDMLKMSVYYGCEMFPEINVDFLWEYFEQRGYGGYLFYRTDARGRIVATPGVQMQDKMKEDIFREYQYQIEFNGNRECHEEILIECRDITGPEEMTDYDLFTAGGLALVGAKKSIFNPSRQAPSETFAIDEYIELYEY